MLEECLGQNPGIDERLEKTKTLIDKRGVTDSLLSEKVIIGAVLSGRMAAAEVDLEPHQFSLEKHRRIYQSIFELEGQGLPTDAYNVAKFLDERKQLGTVDGLGYLLELMTEIPAVVDLSTFEDSIIEKSAARRLIEQILGKVDELVIGGNVDGIRAEIGKIANEQQVTKRTEASYGMSSPWEIMPTQEAVEAMFARQPAGIPTGIPTLDEWTFGLQRKELIIVGARPSDGKTALVTQICSHATKNNYRTHIISLEMSKDQIMKRICCQNVNVSYHRTRMGQTSPEERAALADEYYTLAEKKFKVSDGVDWTIPKIRAHLKYQRYIDEPIDVLAIDYLGLMPITGNERRERRDLDLGEITRSLKLLAKEFNCVIILLSQLNREGEKQNRKPIKSDLKDSGNIEADADTIIMLWHDKTKQEDWGRPAEILLEKQRNGPTGAIPVWFMRESTSFVDREKSF